VTIMEAEVSDAAVDDEKPLVSTDFDADITANTAADDDNGDDCVVSQVMYSLCEDVADVKQEIHGLHGQNTDADTSVGDDNHVLSAAEEVEDVLTVNREYEELSEDNNNTTNDDKDITEDNGDDNEDINDHNNTADDIHNTSEDNEVMSGDNEITDDNNNNTAEDVDNDEDIADNCSDKEVTDQSTPASTTPTTETATLAAEVDTISVQNGELSHEIKFVQNLINLLENYRNLLNCCLTNCSNCSQDQELSVKFQDLELDYIRDLNFAKELIFDNIQSFESKMRRLFTKRTKSSPVKKSETTESKYEYIDAYLGTDSDDNDSDGAGGRQSPDSDYEPTVEDLVEDPADAKVGPAIAPRRVGRPKRAAKRRGRPKGTQSTTGAKRGRKPKSATNRSFTDYQSIGYSFSDNLIEEIDEIIDNFDDTDASEDGIDDSDVAYNPKKSVSTASVKPTVKVGAKRGPKKLKKGLY
jgi:hypothetical protein